MKPSIKYSLLAAALACGFAQAETAYTTPVGYETQTLNPGQYNIVSARLMNPQVYAGTFDSFTSSTLVDNEASYSLSASVDYVIEFSNGASIVTKGSNFSGTTVANLVAIDSSYQTNYVVREATTVADVFGATNEAGLAASANADPTEADIILIPTSTGYTSIFYSTYTENLDYNGWLNAGDFSKVADNVIATSQAIFVQTAKSVAPIKLVTSGEVKKTPTAFTVSNDYNLVSSVYPAGATLASSGISNYLLASANADPTEADKILLPDGNGGYLTAFYSTYTENLDYNGWLNAGTFEKIPNQELTPGFFIQKIGPAFTGLNTPPSSYSSL